MKVPIKLTELRKHQRLLIAAALIVFVGLTALLIAPGDGESVAGRGTVELVIPKGASLQSIAAGLAGEGLIQRPRWFVFQALIRGEERKFKAGRYLIGPGTSAGELRRMLLDGSTSPFKITIPEGLKLDGVAAAWAGIGLVDAEEFVALAADPDLLAKYGIPGPSLEGYLYPDTYEVENTVGARDIIDLQIQRLGRVFTSQMKRRAGALNMTPHQVIILASIIEKEAKLAHERPLISAVFHNRLRNRYPLESCATVLYALGYHKAKLTYKDLRINSPYNTYRFRGLPKGPICSPGLSSIMAALYPAEVDYLFFVANGDGSHTFTRKKSQHDRMRYIFKQNS